MTGENQRRVYTLDNRDLTEEQIAVVFAMTSRSPEPFDEIARKVSEESAATFHERWVLDYGHASVAEHAVVHLAVENISRLAADTLLNNRLASYTEKSSRYQIMASESFHTPASLDSDPSLKSEYNAVCRSLFEDYFRLIEAAIARLKDIHPQGQNERKPAYELRIRRMATDGCRGVLPAATLTNVGMTANARTLEHAISKLMSAHLVEVRELGLEIREQARTITPTLIKYADESQYLRDIPPVIAGPERLLVPPGPPPAAAIISETINPEALLSEALLYRHSRLDYIGNTLQVQDFKENGFNTSVIAAALSHMGPHDDPPREFELVDFTFEFCMDYGALREFRRHRMQTPIYQPLTVRWGVRIPDVIERLKLSEPFIEATKKAEGLFYKLEKNKRSIAQYAVTHAHQQLALSKMNLRECHHFLKLRNAENAHESIREPAKAALEEIRKRHPALVSNL